MLFGAAVLAKVVAAVAAFFVAVTLLEYWNVRRLMKREPEDWPR
jgi:hypothetical protein